MRNIRNEIVEVNERMRCKGYRPVTEADLVAGAELVMVETERYFLSGKGLPPIGMAGTTVIKLADPAVEPSKGEDKKPMVFYHCISPEYDGDCFVPQNQLLLSGYVEGPQFDAYANDTRYFAKAT
jgi:hypothetical protein